MIAVCIFCFKSNKIRDSLLGFLRPLIIKFVNTAMKQEAWPHNGLYRLLRGIQVFIVHLICCLRKRNLLKILLIICIKKKPCTKWNYMLNVLEKIAGPGIVLVFLFFCVVSFRFVFLL